MAKETKVGLLAGLAFIVCFAVILANRGRNSPPVISNSVLTDSPRSASKELPRSALTPRLSSKNSPTARFRPNSMSQPVQPPAHDPHTESSPRFVEAIPTTGAELPGERPIADTPMHSSPSPAGPGKIGASDVDSNREALERVLASRSRQADPIGETRPGFEPNPPPSVPADTQYRAESLPTQNGTSVNDQGPVTPSGQPVRPPVDPAREQLLLRGKEYTVRPSDTLSSIAATHYGNKSRASIRAIFDANRAVLADPDHVQAGVVLHIPELARSTSIQAGRPQTGSTTVATRLDQQARDGKARNASPPATASDSNSFRWYQIKRNDRYASIAREQLGDAARWKELYELNRDKFPDPQRIREGVRIKLPVTVADGTRGNGR